MYRLTNSSGTIKRQAKTKRRAYDLAHSAATQHREPFFVSGPDLAAARVDPMMIRVVARISDGQSRNGGGEKEITAMSVDDAIEEAVAWTRDGDYTTEDGGDAVIDLYVDGMSGKELAHVRVRCRALKRE